MLLETNTQVDFGNQPAGEDIVALTHTWVRTMENDLARAADGAEAATTEAERKIAGKLRDSRAASVASFKIKARLK